MTRWPSAANALIVLLLALEGVASEPLPPGARERLGDPPPRNRSQVRAVALSPEGRTVASGGTDRVVRLRDTATGQPVGQPLFPGGSVFAIAFTEGKTVVTMASEAGRDVAHVWDAASGAELRFVELWRGKRPELVALSPDGRTLAYCRRDESVWIWDVRHARRPRRLDGTSTKKLSLAFSADGRWLGTGGNGGETLLWSVSTGQLMRCLHSPAAFLSHDHAIVLGLDSRVAFSPDGTMLAVPTDAEIQLQDPRTRQVKQRLPTRQEVLCLGFSLDSQRLVAGLSDGRVHVWDMRTGRRLLPLDELQEPVSALAFSADGRAIAAGTITGVVQLWDARTARLRWHEKGHKGTVLSLAFAPDGRAIASSGADGVVCVYDRRGGRQRQSLRGERGNSRVAFAPDSRTLVAAVENAFLGLRESRRRKESEWMDRSLLFWDIDTGNFLRAGRGRQSLGALTFLSDGQTLLTSDQKGSLQRWDFHAGDALPVKGNPQVNPAVPLVLSADGRTLASVALDRQAVWIWETATWTVRSALPCSLTGAACLALSPDGRLLATGSPDSSVLVWDTISGRLLRQFLGHQDTILSLAFSPNGRTLASGGRDASLLLWDLAFLVPPAVRQNVAPEQMEALWKDLAAGQAAPAHQAMRALHAAGPDAVLFLSDRLLKLALLDRALVRSALADLDDRRFPVRRAAAQQLEYWGAQVVPELRLALEGRPTLEVRRRVEELLAKLRDQEPGPEMLRTMRAVEVLEKMGSPQARQALIEVAQQPLETWLTREAKAALGRLQLNGMAP